ncbi:hypothetical protein HK100_003769 [Physocladia obscura]|uniref:Threonine/serine exporter-like N-terminal domain-containing protein n=1 Tax=Physocladia obscura TaxID=109957 RepID=A0AAD5T926_9FUNG|nr:hypothetical protein HK100_003769 [Physocladia obscura]
MDDAIELEHIGNAATKAGGESRIANASSRVHSAAPTSLSDEQTAEPRASPLLTNIAAISENGISKWAFARAASHSPAGSPVIRHLPSVDDVARLGLGLESQLRSRRTFKEPRNGSFEQQENMKHQFLIKLAQSFALYGAPPHRVEHHMSLASNAIGVEAIYFYSPGMVIVTFGSDDNAPYSRPHILKGTQGQNMRKLAQVNALCTALTKGFVELDDAIFILDSIKAERDLFDWYFVLLAFPLSTFTVCIIGFGGGWLDASVAGILGLLVGFLVVIVSNKFPSVEFLLEFLSRGLNGLINPYGYCLNETAVILAAVVILLPGLVLTIGIIEISTRNLVSGTVRVAGALFTALLLGFGMMLGTDMAFWVDSSAIQTSSTCSGSVSKLWATQFKGNTSAINTICGVVIGLLANIYSRTTNDIAIAPILSGILLQVPGSIGVKSSIGLFADGSQENLLSGIQFSAQMLMVGISLAVGLFVATFIVWPKRGPKFD